MTKITFFNKIINNANKKQANNNKPKLSLCKIQNLIKYEYRANKVKYPCYPLNKAFNTDFSNEFIKCEDGSKLKISMQKLQYFIIEM